MSEIFKEYLNLGILNLTYDRLSQHIHTQNKTILEVT